ncbi:aldose 1-epimerase [Paenibacillus thalictri]|uniref:Aldose 1-epimerase n=1 Tax=Paenibacillus thalictri TaxID=2527873 RepID=A0A4Q9DJG1_9BACL|nr:aldose 1-epimerase [Paenibacillus thalictri]TBL74016.1 aldose 1-epimerase [Paenibacillus thalictri]
MIKQIDWQGTQTYVLENDKLSVSVCPSLNNNAYSIWDKTANRELLRTPSGPAALAEQPIQYGTPILMPPNRIAKGQFSFGGRNYQFDINTPVGNHIHGLLRSFPWKVVGTEEKDGKTSITSSIRLSEFPDMQRQYPHDIELQVTYILDGSSLIHSVKAINHGTDTAPFGYGLHTWFLLDGEPDKWTFRLPVSGIWELDETNVPTGQIVPLGEYDKFLEGASLNGSNMDTVFQIGDNDCIAALARGGYELKYSGSPEFKQWVIYTKGEAHDFICLEPYTWVTNAPNIELPADVTGLRGIAPGETLELTVILDVDCPL